MLRDLSRFIGGTILFVMGAQLMAHLIFGIINDDSDMDSLWDLCGLIIVAQILFVASYFCITEDDD